MDHLPRKNNRRQTWRRPVSRSCEGEHEKMQACTGKDGRRSQAPNRGKGRGRRQNPQGVHTCEQGGAVPACAFQIRAGHLQGEKEKHGRGLGLAQCERTKTDVLVSVSDCISAHVAAWHCIQAARRQFGCRPDLVSNRRRKNRGLSRSCRLCDGTKKAEGRGRGRSRRLGHYEIHAQAPDTAAV